MSLVQFLIILGVGTLLSAGAWIMVLMTLDPLANGAIAPLLFYGSAWLATVGFMTMLGFFVRYWLEKEKVPFEQIAVSVRQAVLLASGLIFTLVFQHARLLNGWSFGLLILIIAAVEFFFLAGRAGRSRRATGTP